MFNYTYIIAKKLVVSSIGTNKLKKNNQMEKVHKNLNIFEFLKIRGWDFDAEDVKLS